MKLVIVESPKKCETIRRYLGDGFQVMASQGHIRDLSTHGKGGLGIDIPNGFKPDYVIAPKKAKIVSELTAAAKKADEVYLATDPDREGEAISWHLAQVLKLPVDSTKRLRFQEITKPAVLAAMENPSLIDGNLVRAQEARRMEDRIIGFRLSGLLQKEIHLRSAGRVQSATLSMIVERQAAIDAFVPEEYWTIDAHILINGKDYKVALTKVDDQPFVCHSKEEAEAICSRIPETLRVSSVTKSEKSIVSRPPFTTSSMQQEAYTKFHFSNARTQAIAQRLYEGMDIAGDHVGLITYMRTDSTRISPEFYSHHAVPFIKETYGDEYVGIMRAGKKNENVQDAHEAIRPTGTHRTPDLVAKYVAPDEAKLYRLIYCRAMASLMAPKRVESTSVTLEGNGLEFSLKGTRTLFKGFEVIYGEFDEDDTVLLPLIEEGQTFERVKMDPEQKFTKPEPSYNEASIVKAMEEKGIGRPSTYATTIETLLKRKYVSSNRGVLTPTEEGKKSILFLKKYFEKFVATNYTAEMESTLDKVEAGDESFIDTMTEFYDDFNEIYENGRKLISNDPSRIEVVGTCPECGHDLIVKYNRKGQKFVGCSNWPKCNYIQRKEVQDKPTGELCPECGNPLLVKKNKKGQEFIGCSNFPSCRYTRSMDGKETKPKEKVAYTEADYVKLCPQCKTGHMVVKQGKKAKFLGCTNFPRCRYHEWLNDKNDKTGE